MQICNLWFILCLFGALKSEDAVVTKLNETEFRNGNNNETKKMQMERITQPMAQTQQIDKVVNITSTISVASGGQSDFKPSPPLETYYEYNKFPVVPALPEAKHISSSISSYNEKEWGAAPNAGNTWTTSRVRFPHNTNHKEPYELSKKPSHEKTFSLADFGSNLWNSYNNKKQFEHVPSSVPIAKDGYEWGSVEVPHKTEVVNPWKKIFKFLTAIIPIGLLISALTPTVIQVASVNGSQTRSRAVNILSPLTQLNVSSLNYLNSTKDCEDRILCELLLSATATQNAEQHIQNLLDTFTADGKVVERAEEMKEIFAAVRKQDCGSIICRKTKEKT